MQVCSPSRRWVKLRAVAVSAGLLLFFRVLGGILAEYRWYFPPNFDQSAFLGGHRYSFNPAYAAAFYVHILSGPPAVLLGLFLILSGGRPNLKNWHRLAGRLLAIVILLFLVPSGLVMARQAYAGPIAAAGFASLSLATGASVLAAAWFALRKDFRRHQHFAMHCFILLASPLLLRLVSGVAIVLECESELYYQLNAWLSWLVPLAFYELWCFCTAIINRCGDQPIAISAQGTLS